MTCINTECQEWGNFFFESLLQNHRIVGVGGDLGRSLGPNAPAKAGSLEQAAQVGVQRGPEEVSLICA